MLSSRVVQRHADEVLRISRYFEAPPDLLFRLWADPVHRVRWWGPTGMALSRCEVDFRVGGKWAITMSAQLPDGQATSGAAGSAPRLDGGAYEIIRGRLAAHTADLKQRLDRLNLARKQVFGTIDTKLLATQRVTTSNNCVPRDIVAIGDKLLFGYNVQFGLKTETSPADVFAVYMYRERSFVEQSLARHWAHIDNFESPLSRRNSPLDDVTNAIAQKRGANGCEHRNAITEHVCVRGIDEGVFFDLVTIQISKPNFGVHRDDVVRNLRRIDQMPRCRYVLVLVP